MKTRHSVLGVRETGTPGVSAHATNDSAGLPSLTKNLFAKTALSLAILGTLAACSGHGGSNGRTDADNAAPTGLIFTYPYDGQQDVTLISQMVVDFPGALSGKANDLLQLRTGAAGGKGSSASATFTEDSDQPGIVRITSPDNLLPNTKYYVVAKSAITAGNSSFAQGATLFQFTTRPMPGRPAAGTFQVTEAAPGETNPVTGRTTVFTQFDTVHIALSEPVNPATVTKGDSFKFTNAGGDEVPGRLTISGHELSFDPTDDLAPGKYTISLDDDVKSVFGKSLKSYSQSRTVLSAGKIVEQNLTVSNTSTDASDLPDSILSGQADNLVTITNQLIGSNLQPATNNPERMGVLTRLAQPAQPGFDNSIPATIPAGQKIQLTPLSISLNGDVPTPVTSGPIQVQFASDANVYIMANDLRSNAPTPTAVRLRFDLNNTTLISAAPGTPEYIVQALANGLFNQSALNIQAAGLAIPQDNGDLKISTLGTFPLTVNRTDDLTINFALTLILPAASQTPVQPDTIAPFLTAQVPSACFYVFGTPAYDTVYNQTGAAPTALPEQNCVGVLAAGGVQSTDSGIDDFPIESSPAITFSEPLDPITVNDTSIQLATSDGTNVPVTFETDGSSVTINPDDTLQPDTQYVLTVGANAALKDLGGNALTPNTGGGPNETITFTTEPQVQTNPTPVLLGQLSPGMTCSLTGGDFQNGGDNAGHCVGDMPTANSGDNGDSMAGGGTTTATSENYNVFTSPDNVPVNVYFSKLVQRDTIKLADGCLTGGSDDNDVDGATVAFQQMDGNGNCVGAVPARIGYPNLNGDVTRGFSIRPIGLLDPGTRYWIVVCGTERTTPATSCSTQIMDVDGFALNTDPLNGTGSTTSTGADANANGDGTQASAAQAAAGGPDIVIPVDATGFTTNFYADQFTLPETDTNGNGQFDDANGDGAYESGDERPEQPNRTLVTLTLSLGGATTQIMNTNRSDGKFPNYSALNRPVAIGQTLDNCAATNAVTDDNGSSAIGVARNQCIQVSLLPGGINDLTGIGISSAETATALTGLLTSVLTPDDNDTTTTVGDALGPVLGNLVGVVAASPIVQLPLGAAGQIIAGIIAALPGQNADGSDPVNTGRLLLRYPDQRDGDGNDAGPQSGYIVPECKGSQNGTDYDYAPCFVASLRLIVNAPEGMGVALNQQQIIANVYGPVAFEQSGRLVISLRNANTLTLAATAAGILPSTATIQPGDLKLQLASDEGHGGRAFPQR